MSNDVRRHALLLTILLGCGNADAATVEFTETGTEVPTQSGEKVTLANCNVLMTTPRATQPR